MGDPDQDACSDGTRTNCTSPMRTGTVIEPHENNNCTMGYHVLHEGSLSMEHSA